MVWKYISCLKDLIDGEKERERIGKGKIQMEKEISR